MKADDASPSPSCGRSRAAAGHGWVFDCDAVRTFPLEVADGFFSRLAGLMLRRPPQDETGLLLMGCVSIHTGFMRYALDVAYLDRRGRVLACVCNLVPWRASIGPRGAAHTLELAAGGLAKHGIAEGSRIGHPRLDRRARP